MTMPEDTRRPSAAMLEAASEFYNRQGYDFGADNVDIVRMLAEFAAQAVAAAEKQRDILVCEKLEALVKPIWLKQKPGRDAQSIRSALCFEVSADDEPHDYVVHLLDIAAQRGIDLAAARTKPATISPSDWRTTIAGIKQFGLAADGSDLRDLVASIERLEMKPAANDLERAESFIGWLDNRKRNPDKVQDYADVIGCLKSEFAEVREVGERKGAGEMRERAP